MILYAPNSGDKPSFSSCWNVRTFINDFFVPTMWMIEYRIIRPLPHTTFSFFPFPSSLSFWALSAPEQFSLKSHLVESSGWASVSAGGGLQASEWVIKAHNVNAKIILITEYNLLHEIGNHGSIFHINKWMY